MKTNKAVAAILSNNEGPRLELVLQNLHKFMPCVVFSSENNENTKNICKKFGAEYKVRPEKYNTFFNSNTAAWMFSMVSQEYVLIVNCSHFYPKALLKTFVEVAENGVYDCVFNDVVIHTYAKVVHRAFFRRRSSACIFFKKSSIDFTTAGIHNEIPISEKANRYICPAIDEFSVKMFRDHLIIGVSHLHTKYAAVEAEERFKKGMRAGPISALGKCLLAFLRQYIRCGSILYGSEGLIHSIIQAKMELIIQIQIWEYSRGFSHGNVTEKNVQLRKDLFKEDFDV